MSGLPSTYPFLVGRITMFGDLTRSVSTAWSSHLIYSDVGLNMEVSRFASGVPGESEATLFARIAPPSPELPPLASPLTPDVPWLAPALPFPSALLAGQAESPAVDPPRRVLLAGQAESPAVGPPRRALLPGQVESPAVGPPPCAMLPVPAVPEPSGETAG